MENRVSISNIIRVVVLVLIVAVASAAVTYYTVTASYIKNGTDNNPDTSEISADEKFLQVKQVLKTYYYTELTDEELMLYATEGMATNIGDKYTEYFTKEEFDSFNETASGNYIGIGVSVSMDDDGLLTVMNVFVGSPAEDVGIQKGDKFVKVGDTDVTVFTTSQPIINLIRGEEGTTVDVMIYRESEKRYIELNVLRKTVAITNISGKMLNDDIGYISFLQFDSNCANLFKQICKSLEDQGAKGIIVDVRDNPGGYLDRVVEICDWLLPKGIITYTENKYGITGKYESDAEADEIPLVILTNGYSASASEIFSGALKDYDRAYLIGTQTYGKGLVQTIFSFNDGSGIKVTTSRYFTPSGVCIHGIGVEPDEVVELPEEYQYYSVSLIPREFDTQLQRAIEKIGEMIK